MKLFWTGTDSLMLIDFSMRKITKRPYWLAFRGIVRLLDFFIEGHYCDSENVANNIRKFGTRKPIKILHDKVNYPKPYPKQKHEGFNVIYYNPKTRKDKEFTWWLYGIDIIETVKKSIPYVNFIELDGSVEMSKIYPIANFLIRPNRHDGASRMRQECDINNIPYYWTYTNPNAEDCINSITNEYKRKSKLQQKQNTANY